MATSSYKLTGMRKVILACMVMAVFIHSKAQGKYPAPEFKNTINQLDTLSKKLKSLEKAAAELDIKVKGLGYGGSESFLKISGLQSSVVLPSSQAVFIVKLPDADTDPSTYIELYSFEADQDRRRVKIASRKMMGKTRNVSVPTVSLAFSKIVSGVYLITTNQPLKKGSYGFVLDPASLNSGLSLGSRQSATVFAFDIE
jgi:hypothetical protein